MFPDDLRLWESENRAGPRERPVAMSQETPRSFRVEQADDVTIVTAAVPQIVAENREELYELARQPADGSGRKRVVLNLQNVPQIQSAAIAILINFQKRVREGGGALKICGVTPNVLAVFKLIKMDQVLDLAGTQQEAIDAFHGNGGAGSWFSKIMGGN